MISPTEILFFCPKNEFRSNHILTMSTQIEQQPYRSIFARVNDLVQSNLRSIDADKKIKELIMNAENDCQRDYFTSVLDRDPAQGDILMDDTNTISRREDLVYDEIIYELGKCARYAGDSGLNFTRRRILVLLRKCEKERPTSSDYDSDTSDSDTSD